MIIYSLLFFITTCFSFITEKFKNRSFQLSISVIIIISAVIVTGTRYFLGGYDIYNYYYFFERTLFLNQIDFISILSKDGLFGSDIGYLFLNSLIKTLGFNFFGFTLLVSIFFYSCLFIFFKHYKINILVGLIFFFYKAFLDLTFVYMRQSIAVAIILIALSSLINTKYTRYIFLVLLASTFHFSALVLLVLLPLQKVNITKKNIIIITTLFCLSYSVTLFNIKIFPYFSSFFNFLGGSASLKIDSAAGLNSLYASENMSILHLFEFLILDFLLIISFDNIKRNKENNLIIWVFLCLLPIYTTFANEEIFIRMKYFFILSYPIIFTLVTDKYKEVNKFLALSLVSIICYLGMFKFAYQFDGGALYKYQSYITENVSIFLKR